MDKLKAETYSRYLRAALDEFSGTVISGGTTAGIPGEVGEVAFRMKRRNEKTFNLVAYLPEQLPPDAALDDNYDQFYRTPGNYFSAKELLAYWTALMMNDIDPEKVMVLGINGGRISDMEYRLALGLGAYVGLVENSGRAATGLLADADWKNHKKVLVLPQEELIIWAFVHQNRTSAISSDEIEQTAPRVHQFYIEKKLADGSTSDEALKPWDKLNADLKASNRKQMAFLQRLLAKVGLGLRKSEQPDMFDLSQNYAEKRDYIDAMAEIEHARFVVERLWQGWISGSEKDVENKISSYLTGWEDLPEKIKQYDVEAVQHFQELLNKLGYEIYKKWWF